MVSKLDSHSIRNLMRLIFTVNLTTISVDQIKMNFEINFYSVK